MVKTQTQKEEVILKLTQNPIYQDSSGLVTTVRHDLRKLSLSTLRNLLLLCNLRADDETRN